jgi:2-polyprenyl-3-methyl-5-hydroxy-6-metoxy-1,4-benzoquinol methylase/Flp pilus assembly protein TadD
MNRKDRRAAAKRSEAGGTSLASAPIASLFAEAVRQHQLGRTFDAEALCQAVLGRDAKHAGSLHLLGVIAMQRGLAGEAADYFRKATEARPEIAIGHHSLGNALAAAGRPDAAAIALRQAIHLQPDFAEAHKDLGVLMMRQDKLKEASTCFSRALELVPELAENFADTLATMLQVNPALGEAVARAAAAWPRLAPSDELLGAPGVAAIADDPMLLAVLKLTPVRDPGLEWLLTSVRAALLQRAAHAPDDADKTTLEFCCVLARQCFTSEYVLAESSAELDVVEQQTKLLLEGVAGNAAIPPLRLAAVACYRSLSSLPDSRRLLDRTWPDAIDHLLTQHIREVEQEEQVRLTIPRLTELQGEVASAVRRQYEENPYPRWVVAPSPPARITVDEYVQTRFPLSPFRALGDRAAVEILVAGCGTGEHSIGTARRYKGARVLAIDLSLASLAYAQRKTRELGLQNIEYVQADILALESSGRTFDVIDASGVLHHLSDPEAGWQKLLALLRPGGLMRVGLYSELGRAEIFAARRFIAERGFGATAADIRNCRQALLATPLRSLTRAGDFFNTSGCRDLLFHVQEQRFTIERIKGFLEAQKLAFLGFELDAATLQDYSTKNRNDRPLLDLESWAAFERGRPDTFAGMYQFWCQRA